MPRVRFYSILAALLIACPAAARAGDAFHIADIEARLFYANSGQFSGNLIGNPPLVLRNVVTGDSTADGPSENTLVAVRLEGPPKASTDGLLLHIVAVAGTDTLVDRDFEPGVLNAGGSTWVPCWLYDTGCAPVAIDVALTAGQATDRKRAKIPFTCGE